MEPMTSVPQIAAPATDRNQDAVTPTPRYEPWYIDEHGVVQLLY